MKKWNHRRRLAILLSWIMVLTSVSLPVLADETDVSSCAHVSTVTREEAGEASTCTADGSHTVITVCENCGQELSRETVTDEASGHQYRETARKDASCSEAGSITYTCSVCGDQYYEEIPALQHDYRKTETEEGKVIYTCSLCGDTYTEADVPKGSEAEQGESSDKQAAFDASGEASGGKVTVTAAAGVFPEGAVLNVSDPAPTRAVKGGRSSGTSVTVRSYSYEITVTDSEGNPIQPAEGATVTLSFELKEANDPNLKPRVLHEGAEIPCRAENGTVVAETDGFSKYTVEFYYDQQEYVLAGDSSVALSEILAAVGLTGEVTSVEVSNADLFSASNATGEWIVTAHEAFSTTEWMKVTIGGVTYEITVTDAQEVTVTYVKRSWNGSAVESETVTDTATVLPSNGVMKTGGRYYVNRNIETDGRTGVSGTGTAELILGDGCTLTIPGLYVPPGATLIIYGQANDTGKLSCYPWQQGPGIGGYDKHDNGNIVIHGGNIYARGYNNCAGIGSNDDQTTGYITIYGGTVTATGGDKSAGIGGGKDSDGGVITIYGGNITANSGNNGSGIGGGSGHGATINIYGGNIIANDESLSEWDECWEDGAGIGGGDGGDGGNITINGGTITTYSRDGAGIGGGDDGGGGNITINGGTIYSYYYGQGQGARIGGGCDGKPGNITINGGTIITNGGAGAGIGGGRRNKSGGSVTINGGVIKTSGNYGIGSGDNGSDVAVSLNYTDATEDSISITSSSYNGTVTLEKGFEKVAGSNEVCVALFNEGTVSDNSLLVGDTLKAWNGSINTWQELQVLINGAGDGETIQLVQDLTAIYGIDFALKVPGNKNIILDLNGYRLDRGLADYGTQPQGNVIQNEGILTIRDSSADHTGTITGGNSTDNGGGIVNMGILTLEGGTISGNTSAERGGGIMNEGGAVLNLAGGTITGNTAVSIYGGGIYNMSKMNISGSPVVSGNTAADGDNVFLSSYGSAMKVVGELDQGCQLGVTQGFTGAFTSGLSDKGTAANFFSDDDRYAVSIHDDGEAWLDTAVTVIFDSDGGSEVEAQTVAAGQKAERPEDPTKDGFSFKDWYQVTDAEAGTLADTAFDFENTAVTEDITLKAVWEENAEETVIIKNANVEFSGKIRLKFAFIFPESVLADEGAYVTFEKAGTTTKKLVSEGTADGDAIFFIIPVPAPEFADDIVVRVFDGGDSQLTLKSEKGTDYTADGFTYSVRTYAQNKSESGKTEEIRALAKALFDYGTAAQIYFEYGDFDGLSVDGAVSAVTEDDLAPYALTVTGTKPEGVTSAGIMVEFDTDNTLRITFKTDGSKPVGSYTFLLDGTEKKATKKGKNAYLQIKNIAAPNLDTVHTFSVTDGTDTYTITACALSYAYTSVQNGDSNRQNLGKALYLYNRAADAYFGG